MVVRYPTDKKCGPEEFGERIFLAGGITNCKTWQDDVISNLGEILKGWDTDDLAIFNPRRDNFPMEDPNAAAEQIAWEFRMLERCNIFSMYFCAGESVQPICMYELGRNIAKIKERFGEVNKSPQRWRSRIIVSVEDGYKRAQDVVLQCKMARILVNEHATPLTHAQHIANAWVNLYG